MCPHRRLNSQLAELQPGTFMLFLIPIFLCIKVHSPSIRKCFKWLCKNPIWCIFFYMMITGHAEVSLRDSVAIFMIIIWNNIFLILSQEIQNVVKNWILVKNCNLSLSSSKIIIKKKNDFVLKVTTFLS